MKKNLISLVGNSKHFSLKLWELATEYLISSLIKNPLPITYLWNLFLFFSNFPTNKKLDFRLPQKKNSPLLNECVIPYYFNECFRPFKLSNINHFHFIALQVRQKSHVLLVNRYVSIWHNSWMGDIEVKVSLKSVLEKLQPSDVEEVNFILKDSFPSMFH